MLSSSRTPGILLVGMMFAATLAGGCSGGSSSSPPPARPLPNATKPSDATATQQVTFTIQVPRRQPNARGRGRLDAVYVSPATASVSIGLVTVNGASVANPPAATRGSVPTGCLPAGCTFQIIVSAPVGADGFEIVTEAATGAVISRGTVSVAVTASSPSSVALGANATTLSIGGFVAGIVLTATPNYFSPGVPGNAAVTVNAVDAGGATIVGLTQYATPISLALDGPGFQLSGTALRNRQVTQPLSASSGVTLFYSGQGSNAVLSASSTDASGKVVSASITVSAQGPPPTAPPTLPPVSKTASLYIANAGDNTVAEMTQPNSSPSTMRRVFTGVDANVACPPNFSGAQQIEIQGLAVDPKGDVYTAALGSACNKGDVIFAFDSSAVGNARDHVTGFEYPVIGKNVRNHAELQAAGPGVLWLGDDSGVDYARKVSRSDQFLALASELGAPSAASDECITSPGLPNVPVNGDPCLDSGFNFFIPEDAFYLGGSSFLGAPNGPAFALNENQALVLPAGNETYNQGASGEGNALLSQQIIVVPDQPSTSYPVAAGAWIDSTTSDYNYVGVVALGAAITISAAYDPASKMLFELRGSSGQGGAGGFDCGPLGHPEITCVDSLKHYIILGFDLSILPTTTGGQAAKPSLVLGGDTVGRFGPSQKTSIGDHLNYSRNAIAVSNGRLYVANPYGPDCDATCQSSPATKGEVDVYSASLRGVHINDAQSAPTFVITGPHVNNPTGVAIGPQGLASGVGDLSPAVKPRALPGNLFRKGKR